MIAARSPSSYGSLSQAVAAVKGGKGGGERDKKWVSTESESAQALRLAEVGNHPIQPVIASNPSFFSR